MKTLKLFLALFFISIISFAQEANTQNITVTIDNVKNNKGKVILSLHNKDTFMKADGIKTAESTIENGKVTVIFENVEAGTYGILAMHDENENGRMDFDATRMPLESYGMSNNPMSYGPPQYDDAKFEVSNEDLNLNIRF